MISYIPICGGERQERELERNIHDEEWEGRPL